MSNYTGDPPPFQNYPVYGGLQQPQMHVYSLGWHEQELLRRLVEALERIVQRPIG